MTPEAIREPESDPLEVFGSFVMTYIRDIAIGTMESLLDSDRDSPWCRQLRGELGTLSVDQRALVRRATVVAVDVAIHGLLSQLQEEVDLRADPDLASLADGIEIRVRGATVPKLGDDMHGRVWNEDGWYAKYSKYGEPPLED